MSGLCCKKWRCLYNDCPRVCPNEAADPNSVNCRAKFYNRHDKGDLDTRFQQADYDEIISNSDEYFEKVTITNFDLIHQQCRGDKALHDRKYDETLFKKKVEHELNNQLHRDVFLSSVQRCERKDVYFEKGLQKDHFNQCLSKEELKKKGIFLSSMQKRKKCTDECKSLSF